MQDWTIAYPRGAQRGLCSLSRRISGAEDCRHLWQLDLLSIRLSWRKSFWMLTKWRPDRSHLVAEWPRGGTASDHPHQLTFSNWLSVKAGNRNAPAQEIERTCLYPVLIWEEVSTSTHKELTQDPTCPLLACIPSRLRWFLALGTILVKYGQRVVASPPSASKHPLPAPWRSELLRSH